MDASTIQPPKNIKGIDEGGTMVGSTVAYLRTALSPENGYEVGTFTSPFIEHLMNELV